MDRRKKGASAEPRDVPHFKETVKGNRYQNISPPKRKRKAAAPAADTAAKKMSDLLYLSVFRRCLLEFTISPIRHTKTTEIISINAINR